MDMQRTETNMRYVLSVLLLNLGLMGITQAKPVNYSGFDKLLGAHVKGEQLDYNGFIGAPEFKAFIKTLAETDPNTLPTRNAKLAFYINAYNAFTIAGVCNTGPRSRVCKPQSNRTSLFQTENSQSGRQDGLFESNRERDYPTYV